MCLQKIETIGISCSNGKDGLCVNPLEQPERVIVHWFQVRDLDVYAPCQRAFDKSDLQVDEKFLEILGIRVVRSPTLEVMHEIAACSLRDGLEGYSVRESKDRIVKSHRAHGERLHELFPGMTFEKSTCGYCRRAQALLS